MKKLVILVLYLIYLNTGAQNQAANWYFGFNSGLQFNSTSDTVTPLNNGRLNTIEGCASISDDTGNLLFYTDGITVWNKNHTVMTNGFGLLGDPSSTQSAIIVPKPADDNIFYIFTVDDYTFQQEHYGLNYSVVDLTLDGGLGAITSKNINLLADCSEKIAAVVKDCISESIWVLSFASENGDINVFDTFHAFEVNETGVVSNAVKSPFSNSVFDQRGYLKLSPNGKRMACANATDGLFLYDFDPGTGTVSNPFKINIPGPNNIPYGIEFSPDNKLLYVHSSNDFFDSQNPEENNIPSNHKSKLTQYNLTASNINASAIVIDNRELYRGALQLGPNGKIYRALSITYLQGSSFLGVINNPNQIGLGCNYTHNAIDLSPKLSSQGLPPFISSFFNTKIDIIKNGSSNRNLALCDGDTYFLSADKITGATYTWTKDKVTLGETSHELEITEPGYYQLYINPNNGDCAIEGEAIVQYNKNPNAVDYTLLQCDDDGIYDGITIFNLNEALIELSGGALGTSAEFYRNIERTDEINGESFQNTENPQTIYAKIIDDLTNCYSFSELTLRVSVTDSKDAFLISCDDDGTEDGFYEFNLKNASSQIVEGLPNGLDISYFETYNDALTEKNNLGDYFTNTTPYNQTIYARVENANNCYGISEIALTVNKLPDIVTEDLKYYCINNFPVPITIDSGVLNGVPSDYNYKWSDGQDTYEIEVNKSGKYIVTATNTFGCSKIRTVTIENSGPAMFENIQIHDASENNTITVLVSGEGIYQYRLVNNSSNITTPYQDSTIFENVFPGFYTVFVKDIKNDCGVVSNTVSVIGFPKFFTPNGDGYHDTWQVYGVSNAFQPNTKILIFNRFGKLIKELSPLEEGWNGRLNGLKLPSDDYWFSVTLQDGRVFKGHFSLIN
ncbi:T9SS type B sorting domain-containing protein [Tamlana sp. 2201CG12-4]|uniref:T9SS type B sorting domain-containing protein n=1 Tax=Tamlana sp. 2201CG12-4 TaxID=3112582 RepID=UPI002DBCA031|nr:T9SS type B sorting domain-containing protein [Tamlana sp. 2201CG12-4]MEC3907588.1 T9SS type B sorting domain-containing protein [Tamlana sp. 2201CG12-4]